MQRFASSLWSKIEKNTDVSTGPLARPFARSLAPLTRGTVNDWMAIYSVFFSILTHCVFPARHQRNQSHLVPSRYRRSRLRLLPRHT